MRLATSITLASFLFLPSLSNEIYGQKIKVRGEVQDQNCLAGRYGQIKLEISGGKPPYKINWSNGSNSVMIDHLIAGNYRVEVVDQNGAQQNKTFWVDNETGPKLSIKKGDVGFVEDGFIKLKIESANEPIRVIWPGLPQKTNSLEVNRLKKGYYSVIVYDANNCSAMVNNIEVKGNGK